MEIQQLQYFERIASYENISRAAKELNISQSALSNSINRLETELDTPLFTRVGKKLFLNNAGNQFLKTTRQILFLLTTNRLISKIPSNLAGNLSIMIGQSDLAFFQCLGEYRSQNPDISFHLFLDSQFLDTLLPTQDFLLSTNYHPFFQDIHASIPISHRRLYVVLPKEHPLSTVPEISLSQLSKEKFVFFHYPNGNWERAYTLCVKSGFIPTITYTVDQPLLKLYFLIHKAAIGFVNDDLKEYLEPYFPDLAVLPLKEVAESPLYLSWKEDIPLSTTALDFLDFAKAYFIES